MKLLRQIDVGKRFVGRAAELCPAETVSALEQVPRAVGRAKYSDIVSAVAVVVAGHGQIAARAERNGGETGGRLQKIP